MTTSRHTLASLAFVFALPLGGCNDDDNQTSPVGDFDAGHPDASTVDASHLDAGYPDASAVDAGDPCVSPIADGADTMNFSQTLAALVATCSSDAGLEMGSVSQGQCTDGTDYLIYSTGTPSFAYRYFDSAGAFVAAVNQSDAIDAVCMGKRYWPKRVACPGATITQVRCGTGFPVGTRL